MTFTGSQSISAAKGVRAGFIQPIFPDPQRVASKTPGDQRTPAAPAPRPYQAKLYGGIVTARPRSEQAGGRQLWDVEWKGPQGTVSLVVQLRGQFGSSQLANGSHTKSAIGKFIQSANQPRIWAAQALQTVQNMPVQLNVLDPQLGLSLGVPKDWFSQGVNAVGSGLGNLVGSVSRLSRVFRLPEDTPRQKLFAQNRALVAVRDLTQAKIPVDDRGGFMVPNTEEAGRFLAALVAQSGQAGDPSGTGFGNVQKVGLALGDLAKRYGLSGAFIKGYKKAQDQMAISGLIGVAQTLSSLGPMLARQLAANRLPILTKVPRVDVVAGARTEVKPNAPPIGIGQLLPPVVRRPPTVRNRLTPNVEFNGDKSPAKLPPPNKKSQQMMLPDANTIDIQPISREVIKPVRAALRSKEMNNAIPNPLSTPINRQAVLLDPSRPTQLRGNGKTPPPLGSGSRRPTGGGGINTPAGVHTPPPRSTRNRPSGISKPSIPNLQPFNKPQQDSPPGKLTITPAINSPGVRTYQLNPGEISSVPLSQSGQGDVVLPLNEPAKIGSPLNTTVPRTILPLTSAGTSDPVLPKPTWISPPKSESALPYFPPPSRSAKQPVGATASDAPPDATALSRASGTPSPGLQTYFGLRNVDFYNHPETGALRPLVPGHETQLTIPEGLNIHRDAQGTLVINHPLTGQSWRLHEAARQFPGKVFIAFSPTRELAADIEQARLRSEAAARASRAGAPLPKSVLTVLGQAEAKIFMLGSVRLRVNGSDAAKVAAELGKLHASPGEWAALFSGNPSPRLNAVLQHLAAKGFELKFTNAALDFPVGQNVLRRVDVIEVPLADMLRSRFFVSSQKTSTGNQPSQPGAVATFTWPRPSDLALFRFNGREIPGTQMVEYLGDPLTLAVKRTTGVDLSPSVVLPAKGAIEVQYEAKLQPGDLLPKSMVDKWSHQLTDTGTYSLEIKDGKIYPQVNFRNSYARIIPSRSGLATTNWMDWLVPRQTQADRPKKIVVTGLGKLMGQSAGAVFSIDPKLIGSRGQTGIGGAAAQQLWKLAELTRATPPRGSEPEATLPLNQLMAEMRGANPLKPGHVPIVNVNVREEKGQWRVDFSGLESSALPRYALQDLALLRVQVSPATQLDSMPNQTRGKVLYLKVPTAVLNLMTNRALTAEQGRTALAWLGENLPGRLDRASGQRVLSKAAEALTSRLEPMLRVGVAVDALSADQRGEMLQLLFGIAHRRP
jgi:hypothetical protein